MSNSSGRSFMDKMDRWGSPIKIHSLVFKVTLKNPTSESAKGQGRRRPIKMLSKKTKHHGCHDLAQSY